jgi:hypothetical protein
MLLGDGCRFEYDYYNCFPSCSFFEVDWDVEECQNGVWMSVDSGADAYPCSGCSQDIRNTWSDTCGNTTTTQQICP